jgi:IS30 family transposase
MFVVRLEFNASIIGSKLPTDLHLLTTAFLRQRLGDWKVDTIIGKGHGHAIISLTERKSRLALLRKVERKTSQAVADAIIELMKSLPV